jgi:hypothetical protein
MFIEDMNRKTKKTGKRPCTASVEPVRSAAQLPQAANASDTQVEDRLDQGDREQPTELADEQHQAAHRRQREAVEKPRLDVAGKFDVRVDRGEQRALHERHGDGEGEK